MVDLTLPPVASIAMSSSLGAGRGGIKGARLIHDALYMGARRDTASWSSPLGWAGVGRGGRWLPGAAQVADTASATSERAVA